MGAWAGQNRANGRLGRIALLALCLGSPPVLADPLLPTVPGEADRVIHAVGAAGTLVLPCPPSAGAPGVVRVAASAPALSSLTPTSTPNAALSGSGACTAPPRPPSCGTNPAMRDTFEGMNAVLRKAFGVLQRGRDSLAPKLSCLLGVNITPDLVTAALNDIANAYCTPVGTTASAPAPADSDEIDFDSDPAPGADREGNPTDRRRIQLGCTAASEGYSGSNVPGQAQGYTGTGYRITIELNPDRFARSRTCAPNRPGSPACDMLVHDFMDTAVHEAFHALSGTLASRVTGARTAGSGCAAPPMRTLIGPTCRLGTPRSPLTPTEGKARLRQLKEEQIYKTEVSLGRDEAFAREAAAELLGANGCAEYGTFLNSSGLMN